MGVDVKVLMDLAERLYRESIELGIPAVSHQDGMIMAALAFEKGRRGGVKALDAGAGVGFSTLWIIAGLSASCPDRCYVTAIEAIERRYRRLEKNLGMILERLGVENISVRAVLGDAVEHLRGAGYGEYSYVFIDIEKHLYPQALELLERKIAQDGIAIFHNAISPKPPGVFLEMARKSPWRSIIMPTEAGIMIMYRST